MRKLWMLLVMLTIWGVAFAHGTYQGKSYTFHREGHVIDVNLDQNNLLTVVMDTVEIGTRTNFCTPTP